MLNIYIGHSTNFNFEQDLYQPLKELGNDFNLIFPHIRNIKPIDSKQLINNKEIDLIIAEVSHPSTGLGIELGWANLYQIPIICIYRTGTVPSSSLKVVSKVFLEYQSLSDSILDLKNILLRYHK